MIDDRDFQVDHLLDDDSLLDEDEVDEAQEVGNYLFYYIWLLCKVLIGSLGKTKEMISGEL